MLANMLLDYLPTPIDAQGISVEIKISVEACGWVHGWMGRWDGYFFRFLTLLFQMADEAQVQIALVNNGGQCQKDCTAQIRRVGGPIVNCS